MSDLDAHPDYWNLTDEEREIICNGGGPKGWGWLVPDRMWGLSMTEAFNIHDYDYFIKTPFIISNNRMYSNILTIINRHGGWLKYPRRMRAWGYFQAVSQGGRFFYSILGI